MDSIGALSDDVIGFFISEDCQYITLVRLYENNNNHNNIFYQRLDIINSQNYNTKISIVDSAWGFRYGKYSNNNKFFIINDYDNGIFIWNVNYGLSSKVSKTQYYDWCDFSNDQKYVVTSGLNRLYLQNIIKQTDVEDYNKDTEYLYPNPTDGKLTINIPEIIINEIILTGINGQIFQKFDINKVNYSKNEIILDLSPFAQGSYLLQVNSTAFNHVYKVIIDN